MMAVGEENAHLKGEELAKNPSTPAIPGYHHYIYHDSVGQLMPKGVAFVHIYAHISTMHLLPRDTNMYVVVNSVVPSPGSASPAYSLPRRMYYM
jgi:hypothetical protein